jgi:hypothetical protein
MTLFMSQKLVRNWRRATSVGSGLAFVIAWVVMGLTDHATLPWNAFDRLPIAFFGFGTAGAVLGLAQAVALRGHVATLPWALHTALAMTGASYLSMWSGFPGQLLGGAVFGALLGTSVGTVQMLLLPPHWKHTKPWWVVAWALGLGISAPIFLIGLISLVMFDPPAVSDRFAGLRFFSIGFFLLGAVQGVILGGLTGLVLARTPSGEYASEI